MKAYSAAATFIDNMAMPGRGLEQYYSVEIPVSRLNIVYQFKIWEVRFRSMSILIKEGSNLLNWIKTGDRFKMRYYSHDPIYPCQDLDTELTDIVRQGHGRLRGHYLAVLEIMENQNDGTSFWPYRPYDSHIVPLGMPLIIM